MRVISPKKAGLLLLAVVLVIVMVATVMVRPFVSVTVTREIVLDRGTALDRAILVGADIETIRAIIEADPDVVHIVSDQIDPLHDAVINRRHDVVRLLLEYGADVNAGTGDPEPGNPSLFTAVFNNDLEMVRILVDAGADVMAPSRSSERPSQYAARWGYKEIEEVLVAAERTPVEPERTP